MGQVRSSALLAESNALHAVKNKSRAQQNRLQQISSEWRKLRKSGETARKALIKYGENPAQKGSRRLTKVTKADLAAARRETASRSRRR
jgi:AICAR transformylase/IMP cyclohydrolase PurH